MLDKKPTYTLTAILIVISCVITFSINEYLHHIIYKKTSETISTIESRSRFDDYNMDRLTGYRLIKPLIRAEPKTESEIYADIKFKLTSYIEELKKQQKLISASVYICDFDQGEWMCLNDSETYYPGSLIKVPGLITYLKMSEKNPGLLEKKLLFNNPGNIIPGQTFNSKQIEPGKSYTIRQLLEYMISYSDNNATYLLNKNADVAAFQQLFKDLDIPAFSRNNSKITARNFSAFFKVLFDASYLSQENSEFAVELLEKCDFKLGLVKGLPVNTVVAHKFGEMGDSTTRQLHESGLIYINNVPFLLTIMTKGYDIKMLPEIIGNMSKMVYQDFINRGTD